MSAIDITQRQFEWAQNIVIPRDGRRVSWLLDGSDLKSVSELIPTSCVTDSFPSRGLLYSAFPQVNVPNNDTFQGYAAYNMKEDLRRSDFTRIFFAKLRTDQLTNPAITYETQKLVSWDTILKWIQFIQNTTSKDVYKRYGLVPGQDIFSNATVRKYVSTVAWPQSSLNVEKPLPTEVSWHFQGVEGRMPRVLHKKLVMPGYDPTEHVIFQTGDNLNAATIDSQVFNATNFTTWRDYFESDIVDLNDGLYYRTSVELHSPFLPRLIFTN